MKKEGKEKVGVLPIIFGLALIIIPIGILLILGAFMIFIMFVLMFIALMVIIMGIIILTVRIKEKDFEVY